MSRRTKKWDIQISVGRNWQINAYKKPVNEIAPFDIEQLENLPIKESKKHLISPNWHTHKMPIDTFLMSQIGRDYDEIFAELKQKIPKKYQHRRCIDLSRYKMPNSFHPSVLRWFLSDFDSCRSEPNEGFYVDLATNTLCFIEKTGKKALKEELRSKPVYKPFALDKFVVKTDFGQNYVFHQLLTYEDFRLEAANMKHCVLTYFEYCTHLEQRRSIWRMTSGFNKILTIELIGNNIIQVRGFRNRFASEIEQLAVKKWANWLKLTILEGSFDARNLNEGIAF